MKQVCYINGIPLYEDNSVDEKRMLKGRKEGGSQFVIVHPNTAKIIFRGILIRERKDKLNRINEIS